MDEQARAERFADSLDRLLDNEEVRGDVELAPLLELARRLKAESSAGEPDPEFAARLRRELVDTDPQARPPRAWPMARLNGRVACFPYLTRLAHLGKRWRPRARSWGLAAACAPLVRRRWLLAGLAAALVLALFGAWLSVARPQPVSAQEILDRADAAASDLTASGVRSFVLTEVMRSRPANSRLNAEAGYTGQEQIRTETTRWYEAPDRWRVEDEGTVIGADGQELADRAWHLVNVSDGTDRWHYDLLHKSGQVQRLDPGLDGKGELTRLGQGASDLATALKRATTCGTPVLKGAETVAGRSAYVIDLGPSKCPSASAPEINGPSTIWVDKETFFVLKVVQYSGIDGQLLSTTEVTSIQYNVPIDSARFTFTPPADARVQDSRPKPTPAADQLQQQLEQLARQVDFPLFVPRDIPTGLVPLQPRLEDVAGPQIQLSYVPADEVGTTAMAGPTGVQIIQLKASYELIDRWTGQAQPATIPGGQGWLRRSAGGIKGPGTGSDSAAIVLRDGTLISLASFAVPADDLIKIAASLEPVPGSHPPLPDPTPPALAEIRRRVSFSVFVPTWVPAGLTPEPPVGGEQPTQNVKIVYHTPDGAVGLTVANGWLDCCPGFAKLRSEPVMLPDGVEGHLIRTPTDQYGGLTLWWQRDGTTISLRGPAISEADLVKIAGSMSRTADVGQTSAPPAHPTPTPVAAPSFTILRPTWLPEPMTVHEQYIPNPSGPGSGAVVTFDPRPGDKPHEVLTLTERLVEKPTPESGTSADSQASREHIGERDVTVVRRGEGCVAFSWNQAGVALTLTNPYDPPGPPGQVRYSCDQMRRIVESVASQPASPTPGVAASPAGQPQAAACDPSAFPEPHRSELKQRLAGAIGSGQLQDGPFTFCLVLYADPAIKSQQEASHPSLASDTPGVGWAALWVYRGPDTLGPVEESWGPFPDGVQSVAGYDKLTDGLAGGRSGGGVLLPRNAREGDRVELAIRLDTPTSTHGARIAFALGVRGIQDVAALSWP